MSAPAHAPGFRSYGEQTRQALEPYYRELVSEFFPEPLRF